MDFSKLSSTVKQELPTHPIKIFESLPSLENTPNDLWRGQAEALEDWHEYRMEKDVLVSLNTGAGKTIVGLLIAQSLVNEGKKNVLYICSTIDLVNQTSQEASHIGLEFTTRVKGEFSNDLFEMEKGFCITTYHALFNGLSFLRHKHFPEAIVFDDAHVAESILRDAYTIRIDSSKKSELFYQIAELFTHHFNDLGVAEKFKDSRCKGGPHGTSFVAPRGLQRNKEQLLELFHSNNLSSDSDLRYSFEHLKDHIAVCAAVFTNGVFEISPPFLPSLVMDCFERPIKRVYLSATLQSRTEFIRAFGRGPKKVIKPSNDAGNGERLIIGGIKKDYEFSPKFIKKLSETNKVVIAVPTYSEAQKWEDLATPSNKDNFSQQLAEFRSSKNGSFILVSRVDGIDLPHDTCRLMVLEGLPSGRSLLERFQSDHLNMSNLLATRIANRLAQLFGRINRGRNDFGVFLLVGRDLNIWLSKDRYVSLLPPLLQKQILLGRSVQEGLGITSHSKVTDTINSVLSREQTWLDLYNSKIKQGELDQQQVNKAKHAEPALINAAISEAEYVAHLWNNDFTKARSVIEKSSEEIATFDAPLSGWHCVWLGAAYDLENDLENAEAAYTIASQRIGRGSIALPKKRIINDNLEHDEKNNFHKSLVNYLGFESSDVCKIKCDKVKNSLDGIKSTSSNRAEESVRFLGEILGFEALRPDNDFGKGPDVLWIDYETKDALAFELKTNKKTPTNYRKEDIGQGHNHICWFDGEYNELCLAGLVFVGPEKGIVEDKASPSSHMKFSDVANLSLVIGEVIALLTDLSQLIPLERNFEIQLKSRDQKWKIPSILSKII